MKWRRTMNMLMSLMMVAVFLLSSKSQVLAADHRVPVIIDGVYRVSQQTVDQRQKLYYVLDRSSLEDGVVIAFTTKEKAYIRLGMKTASRLVYSKSVGKSSVMPQSSGGWNSHFYEHANYRGWYFYLGYRYEVNDFGGYGWNDRISSIKSTSVGSWSVLYEHSNYSGYFFAVQAGLDIPDLSYYGWDNVASSAEVY